jgi:hypothetical protein
MQRLSVRTAISTVALSLLGCHVVFAQTYSAIRGIPTPTWGLENVVAKARPSTWTSEVAGYYYVDYTTGTDTGRTYGTPSAPRKTIPTTLWPCAVVEVHGDYNQGHTSPSEILALGTNSPLDGSCTFPFNGPVFIRGQNSSTRPVFKQNIAVKGWYAVVENIVAEFPGNASLGLEIHGHGGYPGAAIAIRHSDISGDLEHGGGIGINNAGFVALWNLAVHDIGDKNAETDTDHHGIKIGGHVGYIWLVHSTCYDNGGDCVQIDDGQLGDVADTHHIFIGGNEMYGNRQAGGWVKAASDVIFSHNISHDHRPGSGGPGDCFGAQYGPERIWFIFNIVYNCDYGFRLGSNDTYATGAPGTGAYFLNNLILNVTDSDDSLIDTSAFRDCALAFWGGRDVYAVNNTVVVASQGLCTTVNGDRHLHAHNNIFDAIATNHLNIETNYGQTQVIDGSLYSPDFDGRIDGTPVHVNPPLTSNSLVRASVDYEDWMGLDFRLADGADGIDFNPTDVSAIYAEFETLYGLNIEFDLLDQPRFVDTLDVGAFEFQGE